MKQYESVSLDEGSISDVEICQNFATITDMIEQSISEGWLPERNKMYIEDIKDIAIRQKRFNDAGDHINTIMSYVKDNEMKAPTEALTRRLLAKLGELQTKLQKINKNN